VGKVIIDDVAARAGVSIKTVSRVMNGEPAVRPAMRERVMAAVSELNYRPNQSARGLAGNRSYLVALLYDNPSPSYLASIQGGILEACQAGAYGMVLQPVDSAAADLLPRVEDFLRRSRVDGLVLTPPVCDRRDLVAMLRAENIPHVSIAPPDPGKGMAVILDDRCAAREMTEYLLQQGHLRIAFIKGHPAHGAGQRRYDGYRDALAQAGIGEEPRLVVQGEFSFQSGVECAAGLLAPDHPPTAIFAANDDMAAGVMSVALERGLRIPEDLAVAGFDDSKLSRQIWPALTTVRQPVRDMGRTAAEILLANIKNSDATKIEQLPYALMIRRSTEAQGQD
jgi:LacI family transcriptional regulator